MKKRILSLALALCLCLSLSVPAWAAGPTFTDVPADHWAYTYVERAAENGWVNGIGNNKFAPNRTLTFAEFYTMIVPVFVSDELAAYQAPAGSPWWQAYMQIGAENLQARTITLDTMYVGPGDMRPDPDEELRKSINQHANEPISRSDAISIMWRVLKKNGLDEQVPNVEETKAKLEADYGYFYLIDETTVPVCYAAGLISGDENGNLNLDSSLTRAEGCVMLCNLVDYVTKNGGTAATKPQDTEKPSTPTQPQQSSGSDGTATAYTLKNGKPITEENVIEMLKEIEKQYPHGTPWSSSKDSLHNPNPVSETLRNNIPVSTTYACGGFAAMVSDLIFPEECEVRVVTDFSKVRPGDIVFDAYRDEESGLFSLVTHVWIALGPCVHGDMVAGPEEAEWMIVGRADGNMGGKISWSWPIFDEGVQKYNAWTPVYPEGTAPIVPDKYGGYQAPFQYILTRYPD